MWLVASISITEMYAYIKNLHILSRTQRCVAILSWGGGVNLCSSEMLGCIPNLRATHLPKRLSALVQKKKLRTKK